MMFKKIIREIKRPFCGIPAQMLSKSAKAAMKRRDGFSIDMFKYYLKSCLVGLCHAKPTPFDILAKHCIDISENAERIVRFGKFVFHSGATCERDLLKGECMDILTQSILGNDDCELLCGEGPYETDQVSFKSGDVVIDAGANMGIFSVFAADRGAAVYAFEPQPKAQELLGLNIKTNGAERNVHLVKLGLSDRKCSIELLEDAENLGAASMVMRSGNRKSAGLMVDCTTLDEWVAENNISRVDFIKADIEGAERLMLDGARETLKKFKPKLAICTYHFPDDPQVLRQKILQHNHDYKIEQRVAKLFAW